MKRITLLIILSALLAACSFSPAGPAPQAGNQPLPASPAPALPSSTATSLIPPTFTLTPTLINAKPSSTPTDTPPPSSTFLLVTLPTGTPVPTETEYVDATATLTGLEGTGFESVEFTASEFHWGSCTPNKTTMTVKVTEPARVFSVVVFIKFRNKSTGSDSGWDDGTGLESNGSGTFNFTFDGNLIGVYANSWMIYQLVATDGAGNEVARTPSFPDKLTLSPCP
jgi:hypothetical protein